MPKKLSRDSIKKAARASQIKSRIDTMKKNLKDGVGVVVGVLDKSGNQGDGHAVIKKDHPQWRQIEKIVTAAVRTDENAAAALLAEADVELTD